MKQSFALGIVILLSVNSYLLHAQTYMSKGIQPKLRIAATGYFGQRIGKAAPGADVQYVKDIRRGADFNADASYYLNANLALGIKYSGFWTAGSTFTGSPNVISNINITYVGPILYTNIPLSSKRSLLSSGVSLGYIRYTDDGWINHEKSFTKGSSAGALIEFCYDLKIYKSLYAGVNTGLTGGVLSKVNVNGREVKLEKDKESLSKVYAGIGLRFIM